MANLHKSDESHGTGKKNSVDIGIRNRPKTVFTVGVGFTNVPMVQAATTPERLEKNFVGVLHMKALTRDQKMRKIDGKRIMPSIFFILQVPPPFGMSAIFAVGA